MYDTPVWYFSNYRNTNIVFPSVESVIYRSVNPLIRPVNTSPSSWWGYAPNCPVPPRTENLKIELKKDSEKRDYIKLNWDGIDTEDITRLIVLRYSPNSLHIEIDKNSSFYEEKNLNEWNTYHYQVFSYNDCGGLAYSDSVKIVYKKDDSLEEHLSVKSALEIIYPNSSSWASIELYRDIYYLYDKIDLDENLNYWDLSLLLINIKWWVFFEDRILALKLLNRLWYIPYGVEIEELVTSESFVSLLAYVNSIIDFQGKIIRWVDKVFELNSGKVFEDLLRVYYVNEALERIEWTSEYNGIFSCLKLEWCEDFGEYRSFMEGLEGYDIWGLAKSLWVDVNDSSKITWSKYTQVLLKILWREVYEEKGYSLKEYEDFMEILNKSLFYWNNIWDKKLDFFSYHILNLNLVWEKNLSSIVSKLTKDYLKKINRLHSELVSVYKLYARLKDYINR